MLTADLHIHSEASYDCDTTVEEILEAAVEAELDVVAVTDHDEIDASHEAVEAAPDYGLTAIPGVEVSTADGHLIGLGVEEKPSSGQPVESTIEAVREQGGIAVIPHPFQRLRNGVGAVRDCDAVETYNSEIDAEPDAESVLRAVREGRTEVHGKRTPLLHTAQQFAARVPGRLKHDLRSLF